MIRKAFDILFGNIHRVCATFMIAGGVVFPLLAPQSQFVPSIAALMAALGGALLSATSEDESVGRKKFNPRITPAARHLVNSINQLVSIVLRVEKEELGEYEGMQHVAEVVPGLRAVVTDLSQITGEQFDPAYHNEVIRKMNQMITGVDDKGRPTTSGTAECKEAASTLREVKRSIESGATANLLTNEMVSCPFCGAKQKISIGLEPPSSASPTCRECGQPFHAHRSRDLTVFTKKPGHPRQSQTKMDICCDNADCKYTFPSRLPSPGTTAQRFCIQCGRSLEIDAAGSIVHSSVAPIVPSSGTPEDHAAKVLLCPTHDYHSTAFFETPDALYAACLGDPAQKHLIRLALRKEG